MRYIFLKNNTTELDTLQAGKYGGQIFEGLKNGTTRELGDKSVVEPIGFRIGDAFARKKKEPQVRETIL